MVVGGMLGVGAVVVVGEGVGVVGGVVDCLGMVTLHYYHHFVGSEHPLVN